MGGFGVMSECDCSKTDFTSNPLKDLLVSTSPTASDVIVGGISSIVTVKKLSDSISLNCGNGDGVTFCGARTV